MLESRLRVEKQTYIVHDDRIDIGVMKDKMIVYYDNNRIVTV